jgi:hypothetical protein
LITFVGFKSSGKNTAAAALYPLGFVSISFADALKDALAAIFCWDRNLLEGISEESRTWRECIDPWWAVKLDIPHFSPRWAMMNVGTEVMRRHFHYDLWVFNVERRMMLLDCPITLPDARFPNEIALTQRFDGKVIRIRRGGEPEWMPWAITANSDAEQRDNARSMLASAGVHESEYAWVNSPIDHVIDNDGTIADLHSKVINWISADSIG